MGLQKAFIVYWSYTDLGQSDPFIAKGKTNKEIGSDIDKIFDKLNCKIETSGS
jgi:hypothetical protein